MTKEVKQPQRLSIKQLTALTAKKSGYTPEEVRDVMEVLYDIMREQLYLGNKLLFERLFTIQIVKPEPKRIRDLKTGKIGLSPAHPKLKVVPSIGLLDYIRETKGSLLKVKRGTPLKRLSHHKGTDKETYFEPKEKVYVDEFPLPRN